MKEDKPTTKSNTILSAIVVAKNEEGKIGECLESLSFCDEIILVDSGSTDSTIKIAKQYKANIIHYTNGSFTQWRNEGLRYAKGEWVLYLDADERVTPLLRNEIIQLTNKSSEFSAYAIPRRNIILGKEMKHGGWWPDYVKRFYKKDCLKKWTGDLHEEPVFAGNLGYLKNPIVHLKHNDLSEMVDKTNKWSEVEARLLYESDHPDMSWWRFFRVMASELWLRLIKLKGFLDGAEGIIYAIYQSWSKFLTYAKLWEMQIESKNNKQ